MTLLDDLLERLCCRCSDPIEGDEHETEDGPAHPECVRQETETMNEIDSPTYSGPERRGAGPPKVRSVDVLLFAEIVSASLTAERDLAEVLELVGPGGETVPFLDGLAEGIARAVAALDGKDEDVPSIRARHRVVALSRTGR